MQDLQHNADEMKRYEKRLSFRKYCFDSDEDEDSFENRIDRDRLTSVKTVLFNIHRVNTGADKLRIPAFIDLLTKLVSDGGDSLTFAHSLTG